MNVNLECPNGGCDPWDRKAKISVMHLEEWYEIEDMLHQWSRMRMVF